MSSVDLSGITHITQDSREVQPGTLFVALKGAKVDAVQFIPQAEALGAVAVLCADDANIPPTGMRIIRVKEPRHALSEIAAQFYPDQPKHLVAVTGTDGKTSTADFYRQFLHLTGYASASIGTLGVVDGEGRHVREGSLTTPGTLALHQIFSELAKSGIQYACMEASSHGLDQYRMHGARLEAAAFTNIARDHLDYHGTEEAYWQAKKKLFSEILPAGGMAVLNADDKRFGELKSICESRRHRIVDFGFNAKAFKILSINPHATGQEVRCELQAQEYMLHIPLVGSFQTMNILAAMGLATAGGVALDNLLAAIPKLQGVPGRLQLAATRDHGAAVYVDYAHTPAALANILSTLRKHTQNRLHVVFGCGGNRDAGKRPEMGKIANDLADVVIVTDDNPRNENPATIRAAILALCPKATEIADRAQAIRVAVEDLEKDDILVIAGKGHEKMQIVGNVEHPHDDVQVAWDAVKAIRS